MPTCFFDAKTLGFIIVEGPGEAIPKGAVEVSSEEYESLFMGQESGKRIAADKKGRPVLVDLPPASAETLAQNERWWRDTQLTQSDGIVSRHRDEIEGGSSTTLTLEQYGELQAYRRLLRDWPSAGEFPLSDHRPSAPHWLAELTQ